MQEMHLHVAEKCIEYIRASRIVVQKSVDDGKSVIVTIYNKI